MKVFDTRLIFIQSFETAFSYKPMKPPDAIPEAAATGPCGATRTAILDAAERLFARNGVDATSIRQITREAGVNLAAVNYHFRTKAHLALEVYARCLGPLNQRRLAMLDAAEQEAGDQPAPLEKVLEALIHPVLSDWVSGHGQEIAFVLLMGRSFQEQTAEVSSFVSRQFAYLVKRFDEALLRAIPGLTQEELVWRLSFLIGALHHSVDIWARYDSHPLRNARTEQFPRPDCQTYARRLTTFVAAGLRAEPFCP